jgi:hypothetical protein
MNYALFFFIFFPPNTFSFFSSAPRSLGVDSNAAVLEKKENVFGNVPNQRFGTPTKSSISCDPKRKKNRCCNSILDFGNTNVNALFCEGYSFGKVF